MRRRGFLATCVGVLTLHILADAKDHPGRLLATKFGRFRDFGACCVHHVCCACCVGPGAVCQPPWAPSWSWSLLQVRLLPATAPPPQARCKLS